MKDITVYFFECYDINTDMFVRSQRPATLDAITKVCGQAIMETALEIDEAELDDEGFRKKNNTDLRPLPRLY